MKLKLMSLFLVLGMFAFGPTVKADDLRAPAEEGVKRSEENRAGVGDWKSVVTSLICTAMNTDFVQAKIPLPTCCQGICGSSPNFTVLGQCAATIFAFYNDQDQRCTNNPKTCAAVKKLVGAVQSACNAYLNPVCNRGGCAIQQVRQACGEVCCNMGAASGITNCLGKNSDSCPNYNSKTCFSPPGATHEAAQAGW